MTEPKRESGCRGHEFQPNEISFIRDCKCAEEFPQDPKEKGCCANLKPGMSQCNGCFDGDHCNGKMELCGKYPHQSHQESWEEEFDREFLDESGEGLYGASLKVADHIKAFISQLLSSARREERKLAKRAVETAIGLARKAERDRILGEIAGLVDRYTNSRGACMDCTLAFAVENKIDALQALDQ